MAPSRRKLSAYVADQIVAGQAESALRELAAELVYSRREKQLSLVVRDIEQALAERGTAIADVASAHKLSGPSRKQIIDFIASQIEATKVELREQVDPSLLGGFHVSVAGREIDATLAHKITQLRAQKV